MSHEREPNNQGPVDTLQPEEPEQREDVHRIQINWPDHLPLNNARYPRERHIARPTPFHPDDDPLEWLSHYGRIARSNNWIDEAKLDAIGAYMSGTALTWFENNHLNWNTYDEFEQAFLLKYHTEAKRTQAHQKLLAYRQGKDSVDDVITTLDRLFRTAEVTDERTKKTTFLRALNRDLARIVMRRAPVDYAEACQFAEAEAQAEIFLDEPRTETFHSNEAIRKVEELSKQIAALTMGILESNESTAKIVEGLFKTRTQDQRDYTRGARRYREDPDYPDDRAIREPRGSRNDRRNDRNMRDTREYKDDNRNYRIENRDDTRNENRNSIRNDLADRHRNRDRDIRPTRDQPRTVRCYRCGEPGSIGVIPPLKPVRRAKTVANASTAVHPATSTVGHAAPKDHPRIEARKPAPIELMKGLPELTMKDVLSNTTVPVPLAHLLYYAPSLRHECTNLFKRHAVRKRGTCIGRPRTRGNQQLGRGSGHLFFSSKRSWP